MKIFVQKLIFNLLKYFKHTYQQEHFPFYAVPRGFNTTGAKLLLCDVTYMYYYMNAF